MKPKPTTGTLVVSLSDMHSGSSVALFPDRFVQFGKDGPNHTPSDNQRRMHDHWIKCAEYVKENRKGKKLVIVHNGDAIEGIHHNSMQVVSPSWDDHVDIHVELMNEFLKVAGFAKNKGDLLYYVSGTESHTANKEERIANEMNAEHYDDELRLRVSGRDLWYTHHGSGAGDGANKGDGYRNWLKRIYWNCLSENKSKPDVVITAHYHKPIYNTYVQDYHTIHGLILPSWQMKTRYAFRAAPFQRNDIGLSCMDITDAGDIRVHKPLIMAMKAIETPGSDLESRVEELEEMAG